MTRALKGKGEAALWLFAHATYTGDDCISWPFSTNGTGYGRFGYLGKGYYAHRFMCALIKGPPPTDRHEAAHSCDNGQKGCVNPNHLSWKTPSANQLDRRTHGTHVTSANGPRGKLTPEQKMEILALKGKEPQRKVAARYNVHFETISRLWRTDPNRTLKAQAWWPDEDAHLMSLRSEGLSVDAIAERLGRKRGSVSGRLQRLTRQGAR